MTFQVFQYSPRPYRKSKAYIEEMKQIVLALTNNPNSKVLWTLPPERAKMIAKGCGIRDKLSLRADPRGRGTIVRLKENQR